MKSEQTQGDFRQKEKPERRERKQDIIDFVETNMPKAPEDEKKEAIELTLALYEKTKEIIAPIIVAFADYLLKQSVQNGGGEKLVFAARDGIGPYKAAGALLKKFPENYSGVKEQELIYAHLTRKVVWNLSPELFKKYFNELGIRSGGHFVLVDIGMYGTIIQPLKSILQNVILDRVEYLISKTGEAKGFIDNDQDKKLPVFENVIGNPAVHFLEDTFSGPIKSPSLLEPTESGLQPNTRNTKYPPAIAAKRQFALLAIEDHVNDLESPDIDLKAALKKFNDFLSDPKEFKKLMVPHER